MRTQLTVAVIAAMLSAGPALAQGRGGGAGGGGGPGGGMGNGPPIGPPGQSGMRGGTADIARELGPQRGQFGRDLAAQQRLTAEQRQQLVLQYRANGERQRAEALELANTLANASRRGQTIPANASRRIRDALQNDMETWRNDFQVGRRDWQAMRDQWLVDRDTLTPQEWAQRRADWFLARDAWIARQREWASARRR